MTKTCTKCGQAKPRDAFHRSKQTTDGLHPWCPECKRDGTQDWISRNRERRDRQIQRWRSANSEKVKGYERKSNARRRAKVKALIDSAKAKPCVDCGIELPPEVMHLDHVRGEKLFGLGKPKTRRPAALRAEIAKCDVRCPNCHALRHYHERKARTA